MSKETHYYNEILDYISGQLNTNFKAMHKDYLIAGAIGEIKKGLHSLVAQKVIDSKELRQFMNEIPPLDLDVFIIVMNKKGNFIVLICEIKDLPSVGLNEVSQLIGYCLIADSNFGLLINVDGKPSKRFLDILANEPHITHIVRLKDYQKELEIDKSLIEEYLFGIMEWNSKTKRIEYTNVSQIKTIPELCKKIASYLG